ncbi:hypothetical protein ACJJTC_015238 [Scirpophaga incertulas]
MSLQRSPPGNSFSSQPNLSMQCDYECSDNVNIRKRKHPDQENFNDFCKEMRNMLNKFQEIQESKLDNLNKAIEELKLRNTKLIESNTEIERLLNENRDGQEKLKERIQLLEVECVHAHDRIDSLENQLSYLQRDHLKKYIEIRNVPKIENENLNEIVTSILKEIDVKIKSEDIIKVYRGGRDSAPIIIKLKEVNQKIDILKAVKSFNLKNKDNKLNSSNLVPGTKAQRIYVSEKLTTKAKTLLSLGKGLIADGYFKYCWISKGTVMLRKEDGLPAIIINSIKDIEKLKNSERSE